MIVGYATMVSFNRTSGMYRAEFVSRNDAADFYARHRVLLLLEGARLLTVPLAGCARRGVGPKARAFREST
jgi:predicted HicB family RNase H-like nuclease